MRTEDGYFINRCLNGDSSAFSFLVDRYKASVFAIAYSKLDNFHDAEDATQEVFTRAYSKLRTLKRWDSFRIWLYTMTLNHCRMQLRSRSARPDREFIEDQKAIQEPSVDPDSDFQMDELLSKTLSKLPEIYRQVIILHYLGEMSTGEVAQFIGVSPDAVRKRLSRARVELREGILAMMSRTFEESKLQAGFTFRMVELVKRIKIKASPMSRITGLSWGLSSTAWIAIAIISFALNLNTVKPVMDLAQAIPADMPALSHSEFFIPVDVTKTSQLSATSTQKKDTKDSQKSFALAPLAEGGKWEKRADMPTAAVWLCTCVLDGKIYAIGGYDGSKTLSTVYEYDPSADTWTQKADMPATKDSSCAAVVNGKIYAISGLLEEGVSLTSTVYEYDPAKDTWGRKADIPTPRQEFATGVVDGKIYAIGGDCPGRISAVEEYDPVTDTWTKKADMPTARGWLGYTAPVVNGKIYIIGGLLDGDVPSAAVEEYDPMMDTWMKKTDMPTARGAMAIGEVNGKIYAIGGYRGGMFLSTVEEYDPATDTWTKKADMPTRRSDLSASAVNGQIYAIGGMAPGRRILSTVEEYTPEGWPFNIIFPQNNLPSTWGKQKQER